MAEWTEEQLAQAWHDLMGSYHSVLCKLDAALRSSHKISSSEFEVLQVLSADRDSEPVRMSQLGERVHLSQSALSRLIANLENDGLVVRAMAIGDRRSVTATITTNGRQRYISARPTQRAVLRDYALQCIPPGTRPPAVGQAVPAVCDNLKYSH